jgi:hypothetical protein
MFAALTGIQPNLPISLDEADDLQEIIEVGNSWRAAKQKNLDIARENTKTQPKGARTVSIDELLGGEG